MIFSGLDKKIKKFFKGEVRGNEFLAGHTSMRIGGPAKLFLIPEDIDDLSAVLKFLNAKKMKTMVIGAGTNLLIDDQALAAAVLKLEAPFFKQITQKDNILFAYAGVNLLSLINFAKMCRLSGCEFLCGIPGTVGGALFMNAGTRDVNDPQGVQYKCIADIVKNVQVTDRAGNVSILTKEELSFGYRCSNLRDYIILGAWFELSPETTDNIQKLINRFSLHRKNTQFINLPNAGCVFKNPDKAQISAGKLIEDCNLKGQSVGDAQISDVHANYIVNKGNARFSQVKELIGKVQKEVYQQFSVSLEPEIEIWENKT
ncbi:MAG: UDP-N-acetylmuramate dehydrogenase [Candidatus Omnitrophota bacterium]